MKYYIIILIILFTFASCYQEGRPIETDGICVSKHYEPSRSSYENGYNSATGKTEFHSVHYSEKFNTVFRTNEGLIFERTESHIYSQFREGDSVNIIYVKLFNKKGIEMGTRFKNVILKPIDNG